MTRDPRDPFAATCPTRHLLDQIADKWSMLALIAIDSAPRRFNALKREIEGISQKVLTQTLRRLERNGLISRSVAPTVPVSVTYAITPLGHSLAVMMETMRTWSIANIDSILAAQSCYDHSRSEAQSLK